MKTIKIIVFCMIILGFGFASLMIPSKVESWSKINGYFTYTNKEYLLSIDYPNTWLDGEKDRTTLSSLNSGFVPVTYNYQVFRAMSSSGTSNIVDSVKSLSLEKVVGIPCLMVQVSPLDHTYQSFKDEMSKNGVIDFSIVEEKPTMVNDVSGVFMSSTFVNNSPSISAVTKNRTYKSYSFVVDNKKMGRMIIFSIVFDPSRYDQQFAKDILSTIRIAK